MGFHVREGKRILTHLKMFSPWGAYTMSRGMRDFFMRIWAQACIDLENDGHVVVRTRPEIPSDRARLYSFSYMFEEPVVPTIVHWDASQGLGIVA